MITAKEAREMAMDMAQDLDWYAPIHASRNGLKCHYYQVNDHVCFEYWKKHEWEFTIDDPLKKGHVVGKVRPFLRMYNGRSTNFKNVIVEKTAAE